MAWGQAVSGIVGTVKDPSGASIPGARLTAIQESTGLQWETVAATDGAFLFPQLPVGTYRVAVEAAGFQRLEQNNILLRVGERQTLHLALAVGATSASVVVDAAAPLVNTTTATLGTVVDQRRIQELPLNGRNPLQLMTLVAGVSPTSGSAIQQGFTYASTFVSASGGRGNTVSFSLDGGDNNDNYTNVAMPFPHPDALGEFQFKVNSFSAEYGNSAGGAVDAVIRSGSKAFHGSMFEYLRNFNMNGTNFFTPGVSDKLIRNQWGFAIGGPAPIPFLGSRGKTFFFASYQGTKLRQTPANGVSISPTAEQRAGDFSALTTAVRDPLTNTPFANNQIPMSRFDPASVKLLEWLPTPPAGTANVFFARKVALDEFQWIGKLDHAISDRHRFFLSFLFTDSNNIPTFLDKNIFSATQGVSITAYTANTGITSIIRPSLLNDFHLNGVRQDSPYRGQAGPDFTSLGIKQPNIAPGALGSIGVSGYFTAFNGWFPNLIVRNQVQLRDSLTWIHGKFETKVGGEVIKRQKNMSSAFLSAGQFAFAGLFSGNNLADYFLGKPSAYTIQTPSDEKLRVTQTNFYVQTNYRASGKLTFNLGLRYEPFLQWKDIFRDQVAVFRPGQKSRRFPNAPANMLFGGDPGVPEGGMNSDLKNWAPRFGFAYDPFGKGKLAIRGAYGIFYDLPNAIMTNRFSSMQPFNNRIDITAPASFSDPFAGRPSFESKQPGDPNFLFTPPIAGQVYPDKFDTPYLQQWNLTLESQLPQNFVARIAYVGSKGSHLMTGREINAAVYGPGATVANTDSRRPYGPTYQSIQVGDFDTNSSYHSLQLTLEKRFSNHFSLLANYTFQKSLDLISNTVGAAQRIPNPRDYRQNRGPSDFDRTHVFVTSGLWELPRLGQQPAVLRSILGGWQLNGILTLSTGGPFSVVSGRDNSLSGIGGDFADQILPNATLDSGRPVQERLAQYFNTAAFTFNAMGTFGNTSRNILRAPGRANLDASIFKNFHIREQINVQLRGEFFNALNRVNFSGPTSNRNSGNFGKILGAGDPRISQVALRLEF
jgi:hypothetical protein